MKQQEKFTSKLYDPRDIEGQPNRDVFEAARLFEEVFKDRPEFVGIDLFGSTIKGYSLPDSDIDIFILLDTGIRSDDLTKDNGMLAAATVSIGRSFEEKAEEISKNFKDITGKEIDVNIFVLNTEDNRERIQQKLLGDEDDAIIVGSIFRRITGKKINEYRQPVIEEIKKLKKSDQEDVVERMALALSEQELLNMYKAEERLGKKLDREAILKQRKEMWRSRIQGFLDL